MTSGTDTIKTAVDLLAPMRCYLDGAAIAAQLESQVAGSSAHYPLLDADAARARALFDRAIAVARSAAGGVDVGQEISAVLDEDWSGITATDAAVLDAAQRLVLLVCVVNWRWAEADPHMAPEAILRAIASLVCRIGAASSRA